MAWCAACPAVLAQSHGEQRQPQELRCESEPQGRRPWQARGGSRRCASACEAERNRAKLRETARNCAGPTGIDAAEARVCPRDPAKLRETPAKLAKLPVKLPAKLLRNCAKLCETNARLQ